MVVIDYKETGERIRKMRKRTGLSARELTKMLGYSDSKTNNIIWRIERGQVAPNLDVLVNLAEIFDINMSLLVARRVV